MNTCDLCDLHDAQVRVLDLPLRDYGGRLAFKPSRGRAASW